MKFTFHGRYENGVLKPAVPLPLKEGMSYTLEIEAGKDVQLTDAERLLFETAGMAHWHGDWETLERIAEDEEFGIHEAKSDLSEHPQ